MIGLAQDRSNSMDFKQAVIRCLRDKYAEFEGRAGLAEFWWFALAIALLNLAMRILGLWLLWQLAVVALLLPGLGAGARRLHDTGKSGWFLLLLLVPVF